MKIMNIKGTDILLDDIDYARFSRYKWFISNESVQRKTMYLGKRVFVSMARLIAECPKGLEVDHIDRNRFNNQRANLRVCTRIQNEMNKPVRKDSQSGLKGVRLIGKSWVARIKINKKFKHLGCFSTKEDAAKAYNAKAKELFGEFAWLNKV